ncbi:hypothetical protein Tsubulata_004634 [Turnera subulata]|uniref:CCHC-type domain-containing protein n=1 Tax=Turnera subulata TaxID=218843 RepID=A0A9Q0GBK9_9ROSI|nr:hypothetical protein Tsubulata_004634 [Turnera subulata]
MTDKLCLTLENDFGKEDIATDEAESNGALALRLSKTVLLGRVVSIRSYSLNFLNNHLKKLWGCKGGLKITQRGFNLFFFTFQLEEDLQWIDLSKSSIWVQVHGLPLSQLNARNAEKVGNVFAGLLEYEISKTNVLNTPRIMHVKVEFWVDKPLLTGFNNIISEDWKPWVRFCYEGLPEFCYFCGRLGHSVVKCWLKGEDDKLPSYDIPEKGFGPWLKGVIPLDRLYLQYRGDEEPAPEKPSAPTTTVSKTSEGPSKVSQIWVPREKKNLDKNMATVTVSAENQEVGNITRASMLPTHVGNLEIHEKGPTSAATEEVVGDSTTIDNTPAEVGGQMGDVLYTPGKRKVVEEGGPAKKKARLDIPHLGVGLCTPPMGPSHVQQAEPGQLQVLPISLGQSPLFMRRWKARARASPPNAVMLQGTQIADDSSVGPSPLIRRVGDSELVPLNGESTGADNGELDAINSDSEAAVADSQPQSRQ